MGGPSPVCVCWCSDSLLTEAKVTPTGLNPPAGASKCPSAVAPFLALTPLAFGSAHLFKMGFFILLLCCRGEEGGALRTT